MSTDSTIDTAAQRRAVMAGVCIALMAVVASVSGLNVAQPQLAVALGASQGEVLWMINIYAVTLAALLLPLGAVGDRWGRKPVLLTGLVVFGIANAAAGAAPSFGVMLAARFLSGVGAAMIMPVTLAVITSTFPAAERSKAIGIWSAVAGGGGILGMFLSALLVDLASWRWLFLLPIVLACAAAFVVSRSVPDTREVSERRFDTVGALCSVVAVVGSTFLLHEGPEQGWTAPMTLLSLGVAVAGTAGFVAWELRQQAPLLDLRLFGKRGLTSGSLSLLAVFGVQAGVFVALYPYFQAVLGWSGLRSTVALMPMAILSMGSSAVAPYIAARIGMRQTMAAGIFLGATGLALMAALVSVDGGYLSVLPGMLAIGLGMGLSMTPSTEAITAALPLERQGVASALNDVTREFGTALGVALLGAVLTAGYRKSIDSRLHEIPTAAADSVRRGIANALAIAETSSPYAQALLRTARESFVTGWQQSMWVGVVVMAALLIYVLARGPEAASPNDLEPRLDAAVAPRATKSWRRPIKRLRAAFVTAALGAGCSSATHESQPGGLGPTHPPEKHGVGGHHHGFADAEAWTKVFDDPARDQWQRPDDVLRALELKPSMIVADVGAGTGYFSVRLARAVSQGEVIATDVEPDMVRFVNERARRERLPNLRALEATPDTSGLAAHSVDRILIVHVWHHLGGRLEYARDLAKALQPGGRLFIVDFHLAAHRGPPANMRVAPDVVIAELEEAGLSAKVSPISLPDQYIVEARQRP